MECLESAPRCRLDCCSASPFDPSQPKGNNTLPRRSTSNLRAEQRASGPRRGGGEPRVPGGAYDRAGFGHDDKEARVVKIGVLIIGSLYWDDEPPRPGWRAERLDCMHPEHVKA